MSPKLAKRHKTHETRRRSETVLRARASRGDSITLGSAHPCTRCPSQSKSPSSIPLSKSSSSISFAPSIRPILESPLVNSALILPPHSALQNFLLEHARRGLAGDQPFNVHTRCAHSQFHPWRMAFPYLVSDCRCCLQSCIMHAPGLRPRR